MTTETFPTRPELTVNARDIFGIDVDLDVPYFATKTELVPDIDENYRFQPDITYSILIGFIYNKRVLLQGYHGTGKSTHFEQIAARLNWPCMRVNLDGHLTRSDLIGRDAIALRDGKQVTEFKQGIIPWCLQRPVALVLDEYDSARPDVMFVLQRLLEAGGKLTLMEENTILTPHPFFRLFATANTVGFGNHSGLYHGVQILNQGQLDRWNIVEHLNYLSEKEEIAIIAARFPELDQELIAQMVALAGLIRQSFIAGDISLVMSPRNVLHLAENYQLYHQDLPRAFAVSFLNRSDEEERAVILELFQRCFGSDASEKLAG